MTKSFLSEFSGDFNRIIEIYPKIETTNDIGEIQISWTVASETNINCFLLLQDKEYNKFAGNEVEYIKTTHKIRVDFGISINEGDKIKDNQGIWYEVVFYNNVPGFDKNDDHLLIFCNIIK